MRSLPRDTGQAVVVIDAWDGGAVGVGKPGDEFIGSDTPEVLGLELVVGVFSLQVFAFEVIVPCS